jgi:hypothetical protein
MNNILMEIFPEAVSNLIVRFNIHPVAELYILDKQKKIMTEPLRLLNLYKERLRLLENKDNKLGLCRDIVNNPQIPNYKKRELIKEYTEHFNVNIRHYEDIIKTLRTIRQFYYDDNDEENEYTHYILNSI